MKIEVDQSGKIEQLNKDTIIAFSNKNQYSVLISKDVYRNNRRPNKILSLDEVKKCLKKR